MSTSFSPLTPTRRAASAGVAVATTIAILSGMFGLAHHYDVKATERLASAHVPVLAHHDTAALPQGRGSSSHT